MKYEKILVAGVAGFLGSYLAESLIQSGIKVVGVDNWTTGSRKSIEHLLQDPLFDFIELNINQRLPESFFKEDWYAIVHIANVEAFSSPKRLELNELLTNSFGVKNLLDLALRTKSRFVFTSTVDIYQGLASHTDLSNYYEHTEQQSVLTLSEAKRYAEALCQEYVSLYGLDVRVARLSEVYGPRMSLDSDSIVSRVISAAIEGKNITVDDVGSRMVYTTYYSDVIYGLNKLILADGEKFKGGIYYLVNKEPVSLLSVVLTVKEYSPHEVVVEFLPRAKDPLFSMPSIDITRSRNELYWDAKVPLQEGIKKTMVHYLSENKLGQPKFSSSEIPEGSFEQTTEPKQQILKKKEEIKHENERSNEEVLIEGESSQAVEAALLHDSISQIQDTLESPSLPKKEEAMQLESPNGWLSLKSKVIQKHDEPKTLKKEPRIISSNKPTKPNWMLKLIGASALFVLIWFAVLPVVGVGFHATAGYTQYKSIKKAFTEVDLQKAETGLSSLAGSVSQVLVYWDRGEWFWQGLGKGKTYLAGRQWLLTLSEVAKAGQYGTAFLETTAPWWKPATLGKDDPLFSEQRSSSRIALSQSEWRLFRQHVVVSRELIEDPIIQELSLFKDRQDTLIDQVNQLDEVTDLNEGLWQNLPQWFGYEGEQTAVILLQNNAELRATGGFIGSYALLTINNGVIGALQVNDIYNADGELLQNIDPLTSPPSPEPIRRYLAEGPLTLRDSNWWPDFSTSADAFSDLFPRATGIVPDWVVGVNLKTIESLVSAVGSLTLPATGETVTADNLFEKAQTASEKNFEPGSERKQDFLGQVTQQLWLSLFPMEGSKFSNIGLVLAQQFGTGQVKLYSTHSDWQSELERSSVTGKLVDSQGDYISVVSSNVGNNKSNNWVDRSTNYSIAIDRDANMKAQLDITFVHRGQSETWPGGKYRDYLRVYLPLGVDVRDVEGFSDEHAVYTESGKTVVAGVVDVALSSTKQVKLSYVLPKAVTFGSDARYSLFVQGQAGIVEEPFSFTMQLPFFMEYDESSYGVLVGKDKMITWDRLLRNYNQATVTVLPQQ